MTIDKKLRECLKQVNPEMVLENVDGETHKAKTWNRYIPFEALRSSASIESDIYNKGRLKITTYASSKAYYNLYQTPLTDFRGKHK